MRPRSVFLCSLPVLLVSALALGACSKSAVQGEESVAPSAAKVDSGEVTTFQAEVSEPESIAQGPDGSLWYTGAVSKEIGRITPSGKVTTFKAEVNFPNGIAQGPDGNLWYTGDIGEIGRITPSGEVTTFDAEVKGPFDITQGSDGNLWYTGNWSSEIGRITP